MPGTLLVNTVNSTSSLTERESLIRGACNLDLKALLDIPHLQQDVYSLAKLELARREDKYAQDSMELARKSVARADESIVIAQRAAVDSKVAIKLMWVTLVIALLTLIATILALFISP